MNLIYISRKFPLSLVWAGLPSHIEFYNSYCNKFKDTIAYKYRGITFLHEVY